MRFCGDVVSADHWPCKIYRAGRAHWRIARFCRYAISSAAQLRITWTDRITHTHTQAKISRLNRVWSKQFTCVISCWKKKTVLQLVWLVWQTCFFFEGTNPQLLTDVEIRACRLQWIDLKATRLRYPNLSSYRRVHIVGFQDAIWILLNSLPMEMSGEDQIQGAAKSNEVQSRYIWGVVLISSK